MQQPEWLDGSCHCERVRFRVRPREQRALECNCSICSKKGFLHLIVEASDFELSAGSDCLQTYTFNTGVAKHHFCRHCGIHPFYRPRSHPDGFSVNLRCLAPGVFERFAIEPFNGREWDEHVHRIR